LGQINVGGRVIMRANVPVTEENCSNSSSIVGTVWGNVVFLTQYSLPFATTKPHRLSN
jgi:hypothetical protein